jgi:hypothetical protein
LQYALLLCLVLITEIIIVVVIIVFRQQVNIGARARLSRDDIYHVAMCVIPSVVKFSEKEAELKFKMKAVLIFYRNWRLHSKFLCEISRVSYPVFTRSAYVIQQTIIYQNEI